MANGENNTVRVRIHIELESELKFWKEELEKRAGYKLDGGKPNASKLCAEILNQLRTKEGRAKKHVTVELRKIPRVGKSEVIIL